MRHYTRRYSDVCNNPPPRLAVFLRGNFADLKLDHLPNEIAILKLRHF